MFLVLLVVMFLYLRYKTKKIRGGSYVFNPDSINSPSAWLGALASTAPKLIGFLI